MCNSHSPRLLQPMHAYPRPLNPLPGDDICRANPAAIDHFDPVNRAVITSQVQRVRVLSGPEKTPDRDVVWISAGIDDLEVQHLDIGIANMQPDRLETSFPLPDGDRIAIRTEEINVSAAEPHPVVASGRPIVDEACRFAKKL